jgi:hypothetical protein
MAVVCGTRQVLADHSVDCLALEVHAGPGGERQETPLQVPTQLVPEPAIKRQRETVFPPVEDLRREQV